MDPIVSEVEKAKAMVEALADNKVGHVIRIMADFHELSFCTNAATCLILGNT